MHCPFKNCPPTIIISFCAMSIALTFVDKKLLESAVIGPEGVVHYTLDTTSGFLGRKISTITAASGLVGIINWREKLFIINGVQQEWEDLEEKTGGLFSSYAIFCFPPTSAS
jgi:hypothetical protein